MINLIGLASVTALFYEFIIALSDSAVSSLPLPAVVMGDLLRSVVVVLYTDSSDMSQTIFDPTRLVRPGKRFYVRGEKITFAHIMVRFKCFMVGYRLYIRIVEHINWISPGFHTKLTRSLPVGEW